MRTIIAGSRDITDYATVCRAISESGFKITHVISGGAPGVDLLGERWARQHGILVTCYPAEWALYRGNAGHVRNVQMGNVADALITIWDGRSTGTADMIAIAREKRLKLHVHIIDQRPAGADTSTNRRADRGATRQSSDGAF